VLSVDELEAAIARDPEDIEVRRVYADALQERDDARGEHIALAFSAAQGDPQAAARVRGLEREAAARLSAPLSKKHVVRLRWRLGFVEHIDIDTRSSDDKKFSRTKLRELIAQRELLPLRGLDLRGIWSTEWNVSRMIQSLPELVAGRPVRWLGIGDGPIDGAHIDGLRRAMPLLDGLGITTTKPRALLPALRAFKDVEIATRKQDSRNLVRALPGALAPDLLRLVLLGMDGIKAEAFESILSRQVFPTLRHFGVMGDHELTWDLLKALIESKLWPELSSFGMCMAEMWDDDDSEAWLRKHAPAFEHLTLFTSELWPDADNGHESGRLGQVLKAFHRPAEAVPEIEHHLQFSGDDSDHFGCWEELGEAMVWAGWPEEALAPLDIGIAKFSDDLDYDSIHTYRTRCDALGALGRWSEALETCAKIIEYDEDDSRNQRTHGRVLRELHRYPEALRAFDKAMQQAADEDEDDRPRSLGWAFVERGRTLWQMRRIDGALRAFANARKKGDPTAVARAWWAEGAIEMQRGRLAEARAALERASESVKATDLESPLYRLGEVQFRLGDHEAALATWRKGAALFSRWFEVGEQAHVLLALGRPAEALAITEGALRENGSARALALHALGRTGEAIAAVEDLGIARGCTSRSACTATSSVR
jgi:uncharacterized protein (TIGR02996 family)